MPNYRKILPQFSLAFLFSYLSIHSAFAVDAQSPQLQFSAKMIDSNSVVFDNALPLIVTNTPGKFLFVGNVEKVLQDIRTKNSKPPAFLSNDRMASEVARSALNIYGSISFLADGKRKLIPIESFAYDRRIDISILSTSSNIETFTPPKIAVSNSKAYLTCANPALTKIIPLSMGRRDLKLPPITVPQTVAIPEDTNFIPNECSITDKEGALIGSIRLANLRQYFKSPFQEVEIIYQPLESIMPLVQEMAISGKIARPQTNIGGTMPGYSVRDNPGGLLMVSPSPNSGFKEGDFVMKLNNQVLNEWVDIQNIIAPMRPGDKVTFTISRNKRLQNIDSILVEEEKPFGGDTWGFRPQPEYVTTKK